MKSKQVQSVAMKCESFPENFMDSDIPMRTARNYKQTQFDFNM